MQTLWQDLRYGVRMLAKNPGFTAVAILTLALGIGANTAMFSYLNAWVIKPLPYPQADRLLIFESHDKKRGWTGGYLTSTSSFLDFQKQNTSFDQTVEWAGWNFNLTGDGNPALVESGRVSWNFFDVLGAKPLLGRTFTPDEDGPGALHVAIISQGLWQSRYSGDPKIIGRNIKIEGEAYTVVGVMPGNFQFPLMGIANLWTPLALTDKERADRGGSFLSAFGRLKPGVTPDQAGAECAAIYGRLESRFPQTNTNLTLLASSMAEAIGKNEGVPQVIICFVIVGLVLLIACANVANLMLARATARTKEFAVRGALGATTPRLARQLLTESLLLFFAGGVAGSFFGLWGMKLIDSWIPGHVRGFLVNYGHVDLDVTTLVFTLGIAVFCGLVFGSAPAFENARLDVNRTLKEASGQASGSKRGARLRQIFVAAEIALAVIVLISATLLVKSFVISVRSSPGYDAEKVMVAQVALPKTKYAQDWRQRSFGEDVLARVRSLPQIVSVGAASSVPYGGFGQGVEVQAVDRPAPRPGERIGARYTAVSRDYLSTMRIGLVQGRFFDSTDEQEGHAPSVIINQTLARQFWPNENPIGQQLRFGDQHKIGTVVGVVNDIKMFSVRERPGRQMYVPLSKFPSSTFGFVVRTSGDSPAMATAIRDAIWGVDRDQPVSSVEPLETLITVANAGESVVAKLMVFFSALAMFLGVIGIYGVMAHLVSQRTHEIGIRIALGATPLQVLSMVINHGLKLALIGISIGLLVALGATRALASQLYQVSPYDPSTFIGVALLFALVALTACYLPARRGTRVDPLVALRYE
ncbi:MAG TPA: ABC transporter permease [Candidatus Acidoferrum sp.]|nr:ABC transporter permease [Candidatus Acidoferrum sp.]